MDIRQNVFTGNAVLPYRDLGGSVDFSGNQGFLKRYFYLQFWLLVSSVVVLSLDADNNCSEVHGELVFYLILLLFVTFVFFIPMVVPLTESCRCRLTSQEKPQNVPSVRGLEPATMWTLGQRANH